MDSTSSFTDKQLADLNTIIERAIELKVDEIFDKLYNRMSTINMDELYEKERLTQKEFNGLVNSGKARLKDTKNETLAPESRFDLAYNAAHSFALAAAVAN